MYMYCKIFVLLFFIFYLCYGYWDKLYKLVYKNWKKRWIIGFNVGVYVNYKKGKFYFRNWCLYDW